MRKVALLQLSNWDLWLHGCIEHLYPEQTKTVLCTGVQMDRPMWMRPLMREILSSHVTTFLMQLKFLSWYLLHFINENLYAQRKENSTHFELLLEVQRYLVFGPLIFLVPSGNWREWVVFIKDDHCSRGQVCIQVYPHSAALLDPCTWTEAFVYFI